MLRLGRSGPEQAFGKNALIGDRESQVPRRDKHTRQLSGHQQERDIIMSLGLILFIVVIVLLLGGFSGRFGGYGYGFGHGGVGVIGANQSCCESPLCSAVVDNGCLAQTRTPAWCTSGHSLRLCAHRDLTR
jgi:Protein of unknown function (DUF3309)